jgi:UDP-N-acetyl-D-mannosaminuronic acid dehydrogenase
MQTICVLGLGYIGLPTAAMFATHGKNVIGVDVSEHVVATLRRGDVHIEEPGLAAFVRDAIGTGRLEIRTTPSFADAFVLAVPTPITADHKPDLSYVWSAAEALVPYLRHGNLIVLESTSPPGTTTRLIPILERSGLHVGTDLRLVHSPERVLPGRILIELVQNDRVIGGYTPECAQVGAELYRAFVTGEILLTDATTAEMVKLMENTFRDVNIALANELSRVAQVVGIDVNEAIGLANHHPRVTILRPGPGVGGHCIAVDPWFIVDAAPQETTLIRAARQVNDGQPAFVVDIVRRVLGSGPGRELAVLGLAYKADVDDMRESPALEVVERLAAAGYGLRLHDAHAVALPDGTPLERDLGTVLDGADALIILTDHAAYRELDPCDARLQRLRGRILIDTRNCVRHERWRAAGFAVHRLGVGDSAPVSVPQ